MVKVQPVGTKRAAGPTSIRLPPELSEFLRSQAHARHASVASMILQLVQNWKDDEDRKLWHGHVGEFCHDCKTHLVDLLYRKEPASGRLLRRYNTPPLNGVDPHEA